MTKETNTGDRNTGNWNTGDWNTGNRNTGYRNTGDWSAGSWNTGYRNTGDWNTGNWNTGDCNTGNWNTGYRNTGNWNTGNWNTGSCNTGSCNSVTPDDMLVFNKPSSRAAWSAAEKPNWMYAGLTQWIAEEDMTDKEKESFPSYVTTGGYLKAFSSLKAAFVDAWEKTTDEDRELTKALPNFDPHVFAEVFGFDPFKSPEPRSDCDGRTVEIDGVSYKLTKIGG